MFSISHQDSRTKARTGILNTAHGIVKTPVFMPVGTKATVKAVTPTELHELNIEIILSNTYHLFLRPGMDIIIKAGGLHKFMNWDSPILTDSGGYQVFSLSSLRKIKENGVEFKSHIDGQKLFLGPVEAMAIQKQLGSDIAMVFDDCPPYPCSRNDAEQSLTRTLKWARECQNQDRAEGQFYFGIIQGSIFKDLRISCLEALVEMNFDGFAIGGLSVGEPDNVMFEVIEWLGPIMPTSSPRYLMGVGTPPQIVTAAANGIDMFDCVLPTRVGRNGCAYTETGMKQIKGAKCKSDFSPIEAGCECYACRHFTKAYIRHLLNVNEILGLRLLTVHNLYFYKNLMKRIRFHIEDNTFREFQQCFLKGYELPGS